MKKSGWVKVAGAVCAGALAVVLLTGFCDEQELVEATYTVKEGDTLRDISEKYLQLNTGGRRYILEFEQGIRELNPELWDNVTIYPGQVIRINYWVKKGE